MFFSFCIHRSKRVQPHQKEDLERLAQYIIRNPFSVEKMHPDPETLEETDEYSIDSYERPVGPE